VQFGYGLNYLIDVEHAVIVDVEPTPARTFDEVASTKTMLERTEQRLDLRPEWLAADTAYGTGKLLAWLLGKNIAPHIPVWERDSSADGMFSRSDFSYDAERDVYVCPKWQALANLRDSPREPRQELSVTSQRLPRLRTQATMHARTVQEDCT
jgi:hypothetical protein